MRRSLVAWLTATLLIVGFLVAIPVAQHVRVNGGATFANIFPTSVCWDAANQDTCIVRTANGVLSMTSSGAVNGMRFPNGANPEYGACQWASNVWTCGSTANGGTSRSTTIASAGNINFAPNGGGNAWSMQTTGHLLASTDNSFDIGASGATRPRNLYLASAIKQIGSITTAGNLGAPTIVAYGDVSAATNTGTASIATFTVGAADATFEVSCNILITTSTTHSFSCDTTYTDEGNSARTMVMPVNQLAGTFVTTGLITNVTGVGPYESAVMTIRAKAATVITVRTSAGGTFTTVIYNARGLIKQVS